MSYDIGLWIYNNLPPELQYMIDVEIQNSYRDDWHHRIKSVNTEICHKWQQDLVGGVCHQQTLFMMNYRKPFTNIDVFTFKTCRVVAPLPLNYW